MELIKNKDELIKCILHLEDDAIVTGVHGDTDISRWFEPEFKKELLELLKE